MIGLDIKLYYRNGWWYNWTLSCMEKKNEWQYLNIKFYYENGWWYVWTFNYSTKMVTIWFNKSYKWTEENWVLIWNILLKFRGIFEVKPAIKRAHSTRASGTRSSHDFFF
jgi:GT2 family glycosyltransferase